MEVLSNIFFEEPDGEIYYDILNSQGKEWLIGSKDIRTAFEIYQPTAIKGKILKSFFPCVCRFPFVYSRLHIKKKKLKLQPEIEHILQRTFGNDVSISCFGGTPCVHQKAVIQIYRNLKILGYCKVARSQDVGYLFDKECENLNYLREKSVDSIPEVLFRCDLDDLKLFCQSSVKDKSGQTIDRMTEKHWLFLANLYNKTRTVIKFEETDYYALLKQVKKNAVVLKETDLEIVQKACELISKKYNNSTVEFGFYHGDFTPWNTVIENGKIKVFDFEYAKRTYPPYLDAVHYLLQKNFFVDGLNDANQIYSSLKESSIWKKFDDRRSLEMVIMYLLEIINLYLSRTSEDSLDEKSRQKIRIEILEKAVTEYANLSR